MWNLQRRKNLPTIMHANCKQSIQFSSKPRKKWTFSSVGKVLDNIEFVIINAPQFFLMKIVQKYNLSEFLCVKGVYLYMQCHKHSIFECKVVWFITKHLVLTNFGSSRWKLPEWNNLWVEPEEVSLKWQKHYMSSCVCQCMCIIHIYVAQNRLAAICKCIWIYGTGNEKY